eukprot:1954580-Rhodomonas_salina.1
MGNTFIKQPHTSSKGPRIPARDFAAVFSSRHADLKYLTQRKGSRMGVCVSSTAVDEPDGKYIKQMDLYSKLVIKLIPPKVKEALKQPPKIHC